MCLLSQVQVGGTFFLHGLYDMIQLIFHSFTDRLTIVYFFNWMVVSLQIGSNPFKSCVFQLFKLEGGNVQWARYRSNPDHYDSREEQEFGDSINSQQAQVTGSTLLMKPNGCRVPHWHFNANEHGYLVKVKLAVIYQLTFFLFCFCKTLQTVAVKHLTQSNYIHCLSNKAIYPAS